jgi:hypothetical protein
MTRLAPAAAVEGSKIAAVSLPLVNSRGESGRLPGVKAGALSTKPEIFN